MNTAEIFLIAFLIVLVFLGVGLTIYFVRRHENSRKSPSDPPKNIPSDQIPLRSLQTPLTGLLSPLTPLPPPTLTPLPSPPIRTIGNRFVQEIYDAITPADNGEAAYNLVIQNQNNLTNLTPFEYGIPAGLGFYAGVYLSNFSANTAMLSIQAQLEAYYSGDNLSDAWCGVRTTFEKAGYLSQVPINWENILVC